MSGKVAIAIDGRVITLGCGCFFRGRIYYRVCEEHKKSTDYEKVADHLVQQGKNLPIINCVAPS